MKKLLFHLLIFTLFAAAAGCSSGKDDDGNPDVRFYAVPASLNFEARKTTLQLSISTTGHWTIVCDDEWLEAVPAEGTGSAKVGITAQANPLAQQRTSSLTIAYGGAEPAVVPVTQKVSGEESVDLFGSTDEMKAYLKARVEACNYAESVTTTAGGVLKFGFKGAATRGVRKEAIPFFTVNGGGYWAADGVATPVKADAEALRGGASPAVTLTAGGTIAFDGADTAAHRTGRLIGPIIARHAYSSASPFPDLNASKPSKNTMTAPPMPMANTNEKPVPSTMKPQTLAANAPHREPTIATREYMVEYSRVPKIVRVISGASTVALA